MRSKPNQQPPMISTYEDDTMALGEEALGGEVENMKKEKKRSVTQTMDLWQSAENPLSPSRI